MTIFNIISLCWIIFITFWLLFAFTNKRAIRYQPMADRLIQTLCLFLAFALLFDFWSKTPINPFAFQLIPATFLPAAIGCALVVAGLLVCLWARVTLGKNWSGIVTVKERHELITHGPYAFVRHPMYTGLCLMFLGTWLAIGTLGGLLGFAVLAYGFWIKLKQEETFMLKQFPDHYPAYMKHVKALVPRVW